MVEVTVTVNSVAHTISFAGGTAGPAGPAGPSGAAGAAGKSAYQVWLDAGNTGTVTQYLASLKGTKGDTGNTGAQGIQGVAGAVGPTGPQGATGLTGATGAVGPQGPAGSGSGGGFFIDALAVSGTLAVANNVLPVGVRIMADTSVVEFTVRVGTAPVGGPITVQLTKNGSAVGTAVSISAGAKTGLVTFTAVPFVRGDILNLNVTAVGTSAAGANLAFSVADTVGAVIDPLLSTPGLIHLFDVSKQGLVDEGAVTGLSDNKGSLALGKLGAGSITYEVDAFGTGLPGIEFIRNGDAALGGASFVAGKSALTLAIPLIVPASPVQSSFLLHADNQLNLIFNSNRSIYVRASNNGTSFTTQSDTSALSAGKHLLILTMGGGTLRIESDGVQVYSVAFTGPFGSNSNGAAFAGNAIQGGNPLEVTLGTIAISNQQLTGSDLAALRTTLGARIGLTL